MKDEKIRIENEFITLGQFLKITDYISSGGEAKFFLGSNDVFVNDEKEERRGRKLYPGSIVIVNGHRYSIS